MTNTIKIVKLYPNDTSLTTKYSVHYNSKVVMLPSDIYLIIKRVLLASECKINTRYEPHGLAMEIDNQLTYHLVIQITSMFEYSQPNYGKEL